MRTAFVAFLDDTHQWLKTPCAELPTTLRRAETFCQHTIRSDALVVVPDARLDARFRDLTIAAENAPVAITIVSMVISPPDASPTDRTCPALRSIDFTASAT